MHKGRLEAFSDGVIAIIITIMVLEFKVPAGNDWAAIASLSTIFLSYALSFIFIGIYWSNHHHLMQVVQHVNGSVLWANLHLLFWLSLVPFATAWMGQSHYASTPVALYGVLLLCSAFAYNILVHYLLKSHGPDSQLAKAIGSKVSQDSKGNLSLLLYASAIPLAIWVKPALAYVLYIVVALMWLVPERRIEKIVEKK